MTKQERIQKNACILVHFYKKKLKSQKLTKKQRFKALVSWTGRNGSLRFWFG